MDLIGSVLSTIAPRRAADYFLWKQYAAACRNYDAGDRGRLNAGWRASNQSAELTDRGYRDTVRARARDLERNSDVLGSILGAFERNVVGPGMQLQAKTDNPELNQAIEELWAEWKKPQNCDVTGTQSFDEICTMLVRRKKVDGGMLIYKTYPKGGLLPFAIQVLEVDELDASRSAPKGKGNRVAGGIEYDSHNKAVGYWISEYDPSGMGIPMGSKFIDAKDVIFFMHKTRPSQLREMSELSSVLSRIRDVNSYMEAVTLKERIAACFGIVIKRNAPGMGSIGRTSHVKDSSSGYDGKSITPGMIMELQPGDEASPVTPPNSGGSADAFVRLQQRMIAAGVGLSYEACSRDMSQVNYSSARQGLIEDERLYKMEQQSLIDHFLNDIYEAFLTAAVLSGKLKIPDFWENKQKYLWNEWVAPARKWIDPLKEANANKIAMSSCQKTFQQIAAENGKDWREQIDDIAAAQEYASEKGLTLFGVPAASTPTESDGEDGDDPAEPNVDADLGENTIAQVSLNGAQISSLLQIVSAVNHGELSYDSAVELIISAFPFDKETAEKILGPKKAIPEIIEEE